MVGKNSIDDLTLEQNYIRRVVGSDEFYVMNPEDVMFIDKGMCIKCLRDKSKSNEYSGWEELYDNNIKAEKLLDFE